ncbi:MAG: cardiolipin synthase [Lentisphaerae bacterium]|nr:cardiolipin synthase [Lentisphaerota bacterium]
MPESEKNNMPPKKRLKIIPVLFIAGFFIIQILAYLLLFIRHFRFIDITISSWLVISLIFAVFIVNTDEDSNIKISWVLLALVFPVFGILLYIFFHLLPGQRIVSRLIKRRKRIARPYNMQNEDVLFNLEQLDKRKKQTADYLYKLGFPVFSNTEVKYFELGENLFEDMFEDLEKAEDFIFMEFFILSPGQILDRVIEILSRKAKDGVRVKFLYDGTNTFFLPKKVIKRLEKAGVECRAYSPVNAILTTVHNNRDHRKILVIDNKIAYTGGVNLADEYANIYQKYGHWLDTGVRLEGEAVKSFTLMVIELWNLRDDNDTHPEYLKTSHSVKSDKLSFSIPFSENPHAKDWVGETVYIDIICQAKDYVYIASPYFTISERMAGALKMAAGMGVDVKLIFPHIGDHGGFPKMVARSYYNELSKKGVKIYEYKPGFVHAKTVVSDNITSLVGTINMDYRSFYLHHENAVLFYDEDLAGKIKEHWDRILGKCILVTQREYKKFNLPSRITGRVLRLFAPLM